MTRMYRELTSRGVPFAPDLKSTLEATTSEMAELMKQMGELPGPPQTTTARRPRSRSRRATRSSGRRRSQAHLARSRGSRRDPGKPPDLCASPADVDAAQERRIVGEETGDLDHAGRCHTPHAHVRTSAWTGTGDEFGDAVARDVTRRN